MKAGQHWSPERATGPARVEASAPTRRRKRSARSHDFVTEVADVVVQEVIEGNLLAYTALIDATGKVVADVQQRADRLWPPGSGVSVRAVTEAVDQSLRDAVRPLLRNSKWFGIAQLQFIATPEGDRYLIDLNGRFYGSLALAVAAGCDLPTAWANLATDRPIEIGEPHPGRPLPMVRGRP